MYCSYHICSFLKVILSRAYVSLGQEMVELMIDEYWSGIQNMSKKTYVATILKSSNEIEDQVLCN